MTVRRINRWIWAVGVPVWLLLFWFILPTVIPAVVPSSFWMEVRKVFVNGSVVGQVQTMQVDRSIYRDFRASFNVQIRRASGGGFVPYCAGGEADVPYRVNATMPDPLTLGWWIGSKSSGPCTIETVELNGERVQMVTLPPGQYYLITQWVIPVPFAQIRIENQSNTFEVLP